MWLTWGTLQKTLMKMAISLQEAKFGFAVMEFSSDITKTRKKLMRLWIQKDGSKLEISSFLIYFRDKSTPMEV
jgi:hypothetical protein